MNLPQGGTCKKICPSECQLTNRIPHHIVILWVGVSCSPLGEYPAFQSNITACIFQADTHLSSYTVSWPRRSQYKSSLLWKLQNSLLWRQHTPSQTPHCWQPVTWPNCRWNADGRRGPGAPSRILIVKPRPITSFGSWDSSSSTNAPPGLPTVTNYNSPTICSMLMLIPLLVSKIMSSTRDWTSLQGHLVIGAQQPCEGKGSGVLLPW
jgi:hypothetical protein